MLDCIEIQPPGSASASVIWLHGLGASGHDFVPVVPELGLGKNHGVRFIFPNAPTRPVTVNNGLVMPAWYDITDLDIAARPDQNGIETSTVQINELIDLEIRAGIAPERIILAGFSQGGAVALHAGLLQGRPLAGIMALSTYLPLREAILSLDLDAHPDTSVFMGHGNQDPVVPVSLGHATRDFLSRLGYGIDWHEYPMAHQVCAPEIADIGTWLRSILGLKT